MKAFRRFKLGNTLFSCSYKINKDPMPAIDYVDIVKKRLSEMMADEIFKKYASSFVMEDDHEYCYKYSIQLLVMNMNDFKSAVEGAIELMPMDAIMRIKAGGINE
jgi:hypothetical protein